MALSTYDKQILSEEDQQKILNLQKAYTTASKAGDAAGKKSAADAAENVRKAYGYSGGADGQQYVALPGYEGAAEMQEVGDNLVKAYSGINDAYKAQAEASKEEIEKQRAATLKQAYIGNMMDQKNIDQQMRASGITGGLSESARVAMQNNYRTNRNNVDAAAMDAKKDVDLSTQQAIAQNEVNRANAKYNADVTSAQFQNNAATNNRNIKLTEESNKLAKEQADINKYMTFMQNGLVDSSNVKQIAAALGTSEDVVMWVSNVAKNGDAKEKALAFMSVGIYDDSFVELFGGHFSAETLKAYANQNRKVPNASISKKSSSSGSGLSGSGGSPISIQEYALNSNYCEGYSESDYAQAAAQYGMSVENFKTIIESFKNEVDASAVKKYTLGDDLITPTDTYTYDELLKLGNSSNYLSKYSQEEKQDVAGQMGLTVSELEALFSKLKDTAIGSTIQF